MIYGIPRVGSKNRMVKDILRLLPTSECLYEPFAGGLAVSHYAMLNNRFQKFLATEIDSDMVWLINTSIANGFTEFPKPHNSTNWRENILSRYLFSYTQDLRTFVGNISCEDYQHFYQMFTDKDPIAQYEAYKLVFDDRTDASMRIITSYCRLIQFGRDVNQFLAEPNHSFRLENKSYLDMEVPSNAVIYADPPYNKTRGYNGIIFDSETFYDWALHIPNPIFISECEMPEDFIEVHQKDLRITLSNNETANKNLRSEKIFVPKHRKEELIGEN